MINRLEVLALAEKIYLSALANDPAAMKGPTLHRQCADAAINLIAAVDDGIEEIVKPAREAQLEELRAAQDAAKKLDAEVLAFVKEPRSLDAIMQLGQNSNANIANSMLRLWHAGKVEAHPHTNDVSRGLLATFDIADRTTWARVMWWAAEGYR